MRLVGALVVLAAVLGGARADPLRDADEVLGRVAMTLATQGGAPTEPALVEELASVGSLQPNVASSDDEQPRFREKRGFFGDVFDKVVGAGVRTTGKLQSLARGLVGDNRDNQQQKYEDCMGCRLVWKQVEMDVSNARYIEDVQASFEHNCMDAQKSNIFYKVCEDMYDDMYAMTDDYMSNKYTVDQMCIRAKICTL